MPREQSTSSVGVSSSVAVFLSITSVCCILSLSATENPDEKQDNRTGTSGGTHMDWFGAPDYTPVRKSIRFSSYVPKIAMLCVMSIGIVAMVVFAFKRRKLTSSDVKSSSRHKLHGKYSFWSITAFFIGVCSLGIDYVVVELSCVGQWTYCDYDIFLINLSEVIFRIVLVVFASCETLVCWMIKDLNFKPSQWVWHGLAVVQAANIAFWFDSVLKESQHRIEENVDSFDAYFTFCKTNQSDAWCSESSIAAQLFIWSSPLLYPITIEFSLLVSETFLDKVIGAKSRNFDENAAEGTSNNSQGNEVDHDALAENRSYFNILWRWVISPFTNVLYLYNNANNSPNERTPMLQNTNENVVAESMPDSTNSSSSKIFILISVITNVVYVVLSILIFIGYKFKKSQTNILQSQVYNDFFVVYAIVYNLFCIIGCAVGIQSCRKFRHQPTHTSFLEYLLLFSTSGVLLQSFKRLMAFAANDVTSRWVSAYCMLEVLDILQALLQIVLYYNAKDVKLQIINDGEQPVSSTRVVVFKNIMLVISISNFATWISDSFLLPEMSTSITPTNYFIEQWPVFDNVANPILIFFRFNSALLFRCVGRDASRPGELHEE